MARRLGLPSERDFWSRGISACAICDGAAPIFRDETLGVVGGGDSAVEEAVYLTKYSPKVPFRACVTLTWSSTINSNTCIDISMVLLILISKLLRRYVNVVVFI